MVNTSIETSFEKTVFSITRRYQLHIDSWGGGGLGAHVHGPTQCWDLNCPGLVHTAIVYMYCNEFICASFLCLDDTVSSESFIISGSFNLSASEEEGL